MRDKINYANCMQRKCEQCRYYNFVLDINKKERRKMKKLKFLIQVTDKNTKEEYKAGQIVKFEDKRANEILAARLTNGECYAIEIKEVEKETTKKMVNKETAIKKQKRVTNNDV